LIEHYTDVVICFCAQVTDMLYV